MLRFVLSGTCVAFLLSIASIASADDTGSTPAPAPEPEAAAPEAPAPEAATRDETPLDTAAGVDPWTKRPIAILGIAGAAPAGSLALGIDFAVARALAIEVAGGFSVYGLPRAALTPRLRLPVSKRVAFGFGGGLAFGGVRQSNEMSCLFCSGNFKKEWSSAVLANGLVDVEGQRATGGFVWRVFGGAGGILNADDFACRGSVRCPREAPILAYMGVALGYAPGPASTRSSP
jgi:hypothetical protein